MFPAPLPSLPQSIKVPTSPYELPGMSFFAPCLSRDKSYQAEPALPPAESNYSRTSVGDDDYNIGVLCQGFSWGHGERP